ncbi:MAG: hypothetical protein R3C30_16660 [Hyphomonadaceae bacterium]
MSGDSYTKLKGKSGAEFMFTIVPRQTTFLANPGVYVLAKEIGPHRYAFCFVGQSGDLSRRPLNSDKTACFDRFGANLIFVLEEHSTSKREQMVADLVQAYQPVCNTQ